MTSAGLRSLFRHHRRKSRVPLANPHRLRHTFGSDMVSAGISLPALMHLMGHSHIETTMLYVAAFSPGSLAPVPSGDLKKNPIRFSLAMNRRDTLQQILSSQIDNLATTLQPNTIANYRQTLRHFLRYLQTFHPQVINLLSCAEIRISSVSFAFCISSNRH